MMKRNFLLMAFITAMSGMPQAAVPGKSSNSNQNIDPMSDKAFNARRGAVILNNNVFAKSEVGIDPKSVERVIKEIKLPLVIRDINDRHDSLVVTQYPFTINGVEYDYVVQIELKDFKNIHWASLEDLKEKRFPGLKGPYVFMIDRNFITRDAASYKVDENFIYDMQVISSADFESQQDFPPFSIIRIFTKTQENIPPVRLR